MLDLFGQTPEVMVFDLGLPEPRDRPDVVPEHVDGGRCAGAFAGLARPQRFG